MPYGPLLPPKNQETEMTRTRTEPLKGAMDPEGRPARLLGEEEVDALLGADEEDEEKDEAGEGEKS